MATSVVYRLACHSVQRILHRSRQPGILRESVVREADRKILISAGPAGQVFERRDQPQMCKLRWIEVRADHSQFVNRVPPSLGQLVKPLRRCTLSLRRGPGTIAHGLGLPNQVQDGVQRAVVDFLGQTLALLFLDTQQTVAK